MANSYYRWQDVYLSLDKILRKPDIFNTFVNIFYSLSSNIKKGFETTLNINKERVVIINPDNGNNYEINGIVPIMELI